jgi:uncharacterized protein YbaR (Trm112 family)/SAM-dependent methyltransferase
MSTDTAAPASSSSRLKAILPLLACPRCGSGLQLSAQAQSLQCNGCAAVYPVRAGVPVLLPESMQEPGVGTVSADDPVSRHPYSPAALEIIEAHRDGWVLDLGAGGKHHRWDNVIQIDIFRFPMTDVVCTADRLPFRDNAFQAVISQAVFEHLQYPEWAAGEIRRVLQPGGTVKIDTAFLQPEHGYPHHFFNATETGLRHWFRDFDIQWSGIESYQHPKWALSWFLDIYLDRIAPEQRALLQQTPLGEVLAALLRSSQGKATAADAQILAAFDALPAHELRTLAAGVSIAAINPPKVNATAPSLHYAESAKRSGSGHDDLRKLLAAKEENVQLRQRLAAMQEQHIVAQDRSRYLAQFYPQSVRDAMRHLTRRIEISWWLRLRFNLSALLRKLVPDATWAQLRLQAAQRHRHANLNPLPLADRASEPPFLSVVLTPSSTAALTDTFFSLVRQTYSGWELVLLEAASQSIAVRHAMSDFQRLDQRVRIVPLAQAEALHHHAAKPATLARYRLYLPEGATLAFHAIQSLVTLVRDRPQTASISVDFERTLTEAGTPMRCYAGPVDSACVPTTDSWSYYVATSVQNLALLDATQRQDFVHAHIPEVLCRHPAALAQLAS